MPPCVRLVAIDMDGTLLPSVGGDVTPRTRRALEQAREAGIEIVIATGRRHRYASPILERAGQPAETTLISSNGSVTRRLDGKRINHFTMSPETARALCGVLRPYDGTVVFTFDREGPGEMVIESMAAAHRQIHGWVDANRDVLLEICPLEHAFADGSEPIQGMICGGVEAMREAELRLRGGDYAERVAMQRTEYASRNLTILDLLPPGCSKGQALAQLAEQRGLTFEQVMAIGDNWNDLKMLEWAGHAVVMGNGAPDMVEHAQRQGWRMAPCNNEDGVAQVLESLIAERTETVSRPLERAFEAAQ